MNAKFTPGPWVFDEEGFVFAVPMSEGRMIAQVRGWGWLQKKGEEAGGAEQKANGVLLAAAPQLLAALLQCKGQWIHSVNADACFAALRAAGDDTPDYRRGHYKTSLLEGDR